MKVPNAVAKWTLSLAVLALGAVLTPAVPAHAAQVNPNNNGGHRAGGQTVKAVVKLADAPVSGITVSFKKSGKAAVTATTDADGSLSLDLPSGYYTVTAKNDSGSVVKHIHVVTSTTPLLLTLTLTAPPAK